MTFQELDDPSQAVENRPTERFVDTPSTSKVLLGSTCWAELLLLFACSLVATGSFVIQLYVLTLLILSMDLCALI